MAFDAHKNLAIASVVTAPTPPTSGTSITVGAGEGARFPAVPFNATVWPFDMAPDPTTAEVVRVTARTGDVLTIARIQEGTAARAIVAGDLIAATITAKALTDIESGVNFPQILTPGNVAFTGAVGVVQMNTADGADNAILQFNGGGGSGSSRGATINMFGNESGAGPGDLSLYTGAPGKISFYTSGNLRGQMHPSGGFSWGGTTDPGAAHLSVAGNLTAAGVHAVGYGGRFSGAPTPGSGGPAGEMIYVSGKAYMLGYDRNAGAYVPLGFDGTSITLNTSGTPRGTIHASGGFSWGGTTDPGAGAFLVGAGAPAASQAHVAIYPAGQIQISPGTTAATIIESFYNPNGNVGSIVLSGTTTAYNTTSDARLKTPLSRHTDTEVLRQTVIHNFVWKSDGTAGRGVFAQEAQLVAPFAVSVGTDDVDDEGRLTHPWGVDYSKYVPDLITGWQEHDKDVAALWSEIVELRADLAVMVATINAPPYQSPHGGSMMLQRVRDWMDRIRAWLFPQESPCV